MNALGWAAVAVPAAAALGSMLLRQRDAVGWVAVGAAGLTLGFAAVLGGWPGAGGVLRVDPLAAHFAVLVAAAGVLAAWYGRRSSGGARGLVLLAGLELAVLAEAPGLGWAGLAAAALAGMPAGGQAAWRALRMVVPALGLALMGVVLLAQAGPFLEWADLGAAAPGMAPALLSLGFVLLLAGLAVLAGLAPVQGWMGPAARHSALAAVALLVLLRGRAVVAAHQEALAPGPPLVVLGLASLAWAVAGLWRGRGQVGDAALFQVGLAAVAFGLGGGEAMAAGLLLLTLGVLLVPVVAGGDGVAVGALLALALLPPFAGFGAGLALLDAAAAEGMWLAVPLAALLAGGAVGLVRAAAASWRGAAGPRGRDIIGALMLAVAVAAGMVPAASRWFAFLAEGL